MFNDKVYVSQDLGIFCLFAFYKIYKNFYKLFKAL